MGNIVEVKNFRISFGKKVVIRDLSFEVKAGEVFGFLSVSAS